MDLKTYIQSAHGNGSTLALALEIPPSYLSQMASGNRSVTPERASKIELATAKAVMRWDLRPEDWYRIWPELIESKGAPKVPAEVSNPNPDLPHATAAKKALATERATTQGS